MAPFFSGLFVTISVTNFVTKTTRDGVRQKDGKLEKC